MANTRYISYRIGSIRNIQHITRAMKLVAAARLKKAQERLDAARPYARKMAEVTLDLAALELESAHSLLTPRLERRRTLVVIFTGDRGLCGGYHERVVGYGLNFADKLAADGEVLLYAVGRQGMKILRRLRRPVAYSYTEPVKGVTFATAKALAAQLVKGYLRGEYDGIHLVFARYYSALRQNPRSFQLLPIDPSLARQAPPGRLFLFEPSMEEAINGILPRYAESEVFRAFLECETGELGARMGAMTNATDNAAEMIDRLMLEYNRARQALVTREISEIIGGAEVLR